MKFESEKSLLLLNIKMYCVQDWENRESCKIEFHLYIKKNNKPNFVSRQNQWIAKSLVPANPFS